MGETRALHEALKQAPLQFWDITRAEVLKAFRGHGRYGSESSGDGYITETSMMRLVEFAESGWVNVPDAAARLLRSRMARPTCLFLKKFPDSIPKDEIRNAIARDVHDRIWSHILMWNQEFPQFVSEEQIREVVGDFEQVIISRFQKRNERLKLAKKLPDFVDFMKVAEVHET